MAPRNNKTCSYLLWSPIIVASNRVRYTRCIIPSRVTLGDKITHTPLELFSDPVYPPKHLGGGGTTHNEKMVALEILTFRREGLHVWTHRSSYSVLPPRYRETQR